MGQGLDGDRPETAIWAMSHFDVAFQRQECDIFVRVGLGGFWEV